MKARRILGRSRAGAKVHRGVQPAARPDAYGRARVRDLDGLLVQALNRARALDFELPRRRVLELSLALAGISVRSVSRPVCSIWTSVTTGPAA